MKSFTLPGSDLRVSSVVLGLMRINDKTDEQIRSLLAAARNAGINFLDHADIYGSYRHECEERFAAATKLSAAERSEWIIQSKCGIASGYFDFSYKHIIESVHGSLQALNTDYLDILLLHRPDTLVEPEEVAKAFDELQSSGKVRAFGVSNQTPGQIELLKKCVMQPIIANQLQLSITHAPIITQGIATNMQGVDQSIDRDNGILDYCRLNDITIQAWSPFQKGFFDGVFLADPEFGELNTVLDRLAEKYQVTPMAIALAWITRHPANMQVVLGTTTPQRVSDAAAGADIVLTRPEWYELFTAAGHVLP